MQLIPGNIHRQVPHTGGFSIQILIDKGKILKKIYKSWAGV